MIEHITNLAGRPVRQFTPTFMGQSDLSTAALRFGLPEHWEETDEELWEQLNAIVEHPGVESLPALGLGVWGKYPLGESSQVFQKFLIEHQHRFSGLEAMYLGLDLTDWLKHVNHGDVQPLISAFPGLKYFGVRGTCDLELSPIRHVCLEELVIVGAGLRKGVLEGLEQSVLPELTRLELWIGSEDCGYDGSITNFESLFSGELLPNLKHLGLRNAKNVDKIAEALKGAPILEQLDSLDLSLGCLTDEGASNLLENPAIKELKMLDIHWHYLSKRMQTEFAILGPVSINASQPEYQNQAIDQLNCSNNLRGGLYLEDYYHHQYNRVDWPY